MESLLVQTSWCESSDSWPEKTCYVHITTSTTSAYSGEHPDQSDSNLRAICVTSTRHARHSGSGFACTPGAEAVQWQTSCDTKSREIHIAIECNWVVSTKHKGLLDTMLDIMNMIYLKANCKFNHSRTLEAALAFANQVWFTCHVQALSAERRHAGHSGI
jgi:hypothetical protein